jgi:hypothetical protein
MRALFITLPLCALSCISGVLADGGWDADHCLKQSEADHLVSTFAALINLPPDDPSFKPGLDAIAAPTYQEISDSFNIVAGLPLGGPTEVDRAAVETDHAAHPSVVIKTINTWVACQNITWHWIMTVAPNGPPIRGITMWETKNKIFQRGTLEHNSVAFALNLGFTVTRPDGTPLTPIY